MKEKKLDKLEIIELIKETWPDTKEAEEYFESTQG